VSPVTLLPYCSSLASISSLTSPTSNRFNFLSVYEAEILKALWPFNRLMIPQPQRSLFVFTLHINSNPIQFSFYRHDFQVSYASFLPHLHPDLKSTKCALETNRSALLSLYLWIPHPTPSFRCFFIHLGVAMNLHPFAIQSYFRNAAATRIQQQAGHSLRTQHFLSSPHPAPPSRLSTVVLHLFFSVHRSHRSGNGNPSELPPVCRIR
jgi:hypothetical protein